MLAAMSTGVIDGSRVGSDAAAGHGRFAVPWPRATAWVAVITLAGLVLRLPSFGDSLFGDEVGAYWIVAGHSLGRVLYYTSAHPPSPELNPPLWFVLAWFSVKVFGLSAWSLKLVSLLCGTATIPLTNLLGRLTIGVRAGLAGATLVAFSPFLIYYSTEARPYALLAFLGLASSLALLRALRDGSRGWWVLYALCACGVAYTHYTGVFLLAAQFLWAFVAYPRARRALLVATALAAVGFLPWVPALIRTAHSPGVKIYGFLEPFRLHDIPTDLSKAAIGHPYLSLSRVPGEVAAILVLAGVAVAAVGALRRAAATRPALSRELTLIVVLAAAAPVGAALYSLVRESVWDARDLISSWPAFGVLLGGLATYPRMPWRAGALALVLVGFLLGGLKLSQTAQQRPDYDSAAAFIVQHSAPTAPVVDLPAPSPGPPTETDAALALARPGEHHPVLRLGGPPLAEVLRSPAYTSLPAPSGLVVARQAAALAGEGELFLILPARVPIGKLAAARRRHVVSGTGALADLAEFLSALPARFHLVTSRTYPGLFPVSVYAYRG
jgi:4-amino-4-deoxy-L-arabinose transferase-like glycosyltransferase